jgi:hypothetical protein
MHPKGFPRNPGELTISARESGNAAAKGDRRRPHRDGGAVLRTRSTCEGGEPQGFREERPGDPLEGRGEQVHVSDDKKHRRGSELDTLCPRDKNREIGEEMNLVSALRSEKSLVDVAGIEPATPCLQSMRLDSTYSIHYYQLLTFPTTGGTCLSLNAMPNGIKKFDSCTVGAR